LLVQLSRVEAVGGEGLQDRALEHLRGGRGWRTL